MPLVRLSKFTKPKKREIERLNTPFYRRGNKFLVGDFRKSTRYMRGIDVVDSNDFINLTSDLKIQLSTYERRNARSTFFVLLNNLNDSINGKC